jgi:hypothetical protein
MKKVIVIYGNYGAQHVGMGKPFFDKFRSVQEIEEQASACCTLDMQKLSNATSKTYLDEVAVAYPLLVTWQAAIGGLVYEALGDHQVDLVSVGWGVGFYGALAATRSMSLADSLYMVMKIAASIAPFHGNHEWDTIVIPYDQKKIQHRQELEYYIGETPHVISFEYFDQLVTSLLLPEAMVCTGQYSLIQKILQEYPQLKHDDTKVPIETVWNWLNDQEISNLLMQYLQKIDVHAPQFGQLITVTAVSKELVTRDPVILLDDIKQQLQEPWSLDGIIKKAQEHDLCVLVCPDDVIKQQIYENVDRDILLIETPEDISKLRELMQP